MKWPVCLLSNARQKIRCCRQIDAKIDSSILVNAVEPINPYRRLPEELFAVFFLAEYIVLGRVRFRLPDAIRVMGLVVQNQNVLF